MLYLAGRYSVTPNMLVIPPQMSLYMSLAPEQKLTYPLAGPAGPEAFNGGVEGFEAKSFRGLGVFTSTPYETSDDQDSVQMLQRSTQVGEFYRMSPPAVYDASQRLPSWYMDIMIYDEESDRHVHITFRQAMRATCYGHPDGPKGDIFKLKEALANATTAKNISDSADAMGYNGGVQRAWAKDTLSDLLDAVKVEGGAKDDKAEQNLADHIIDAVEAGIWMPVEIVIARPFIEHLMLSAVVAVAGRDTGATLFGPADM
jgi:hypothetical protein